MYRNINLRFKGFLLLLLVLCSILLIPACAPQESAVSSSSSNAFNVSTSVESSSLSSSLTEESFLEVCFFDVEQADSALFRSPDGKTMLIDAGDVATKYTLQEKLELIKASGSFAVAMDIDAAGLPFLKNLMPPAGSKTVEELHEVAEMAGVPFIVKGIMTRQGALKAVEAGASAIIVSNHGGRVLDQCPATAEVLEDIVKAVDGKAKIIVDGGIRSGVDVFKALAMGADAVLIARPFVTAVYGGAREGVQAYIDKIGAELSDTMTMCGAANLKEITRDMVWRA